LVSNRLSVPRALVLALLLPLALGACGRKGPLDPPPSAAVPSPPPAAQSRFIDPTTPTGGAQQAQPAPVQTTQAAQQPAKKTFFLDPLIR
jgi:predicted small lipoprotein YifL